MNNLKKYRKERGLSQSQLAKQIGLKLHSFISQCENGRRPLPYNLAVKISKVLNCNVYDLMGDDLLKSKLPKNEKDRAITALEKSSKKSFEQLLSELTQSYYSEWVFNDFTSTRDKLYFYICNLLISYPKVITDEDLLKLHLLIAKYMEDNKIFEKSAYLEFKEDLDKFDDQNKKEGGKPNEKNN